MPSLNCYYYYCTLAVYTMINRVVLWNRLNRAMATTTGNHIRLDLLVTLLFLAWFFPLIVQPTDRDITSTFTSVHGPDSIVQSQDNTTQVSLTMAIHASSLHSAAGLKRYLSSPSMALLLILMAGDIQLNPGPVKFPCTHCSKPVRCNQMGLQCDLCEHWVHGKCEHLSKQDYLRLSADSSPWFCKNCTFTTLPFSNSSTLHSEPDISMESIPDTSSSLPDEHSFHFSPNENTFKYLKSIKGIKFGHLNICSIFPKMDYLKILLFDKPLDVLVISETWLNDSYDNSELCIPGYNMERLDRTHKKGGGLCIYINDRFSYDRVEISEFPGPDMEPASMSGLETLWIKFKLPKTKPIFICGLYRPPNISVSDSLLDLESQMDHICPGGSETFILGDFNINYGPSKDPACKPFSFHQT